jgi:hypothetical protein
MTGNPWHTPATDGERNTRAAIADRRPDPGYLATLLGREPRCPLESHPPTALGFALAASAGALFALAIVALFWRY